MRAAAIILLFLGARLFGQNESPDPSSFEIEPPILIPDRHDAVSAEAKPPASPPDLDLAKLEKEFERAKKSAVNAEHFCKIGALSKVEVEQRILRLAHLEADLANARLTLAKEEMLQQPKVSHESKRESSSPVEANLALAIEAAHAAAANRERTEIEAAEANVQRQKKLLSFGRARKSDVARAEQKLADLKAQKN